MHARRNGLPVDRHPCQHCGKLYDTKSGRERHVKIAHEGVTYDKVSCPECGRVYNTTGGLWYHRSTQHGVKAQSYRKRVSGDKYLTAEEKAKLEEAKAKERDRVY